MKNSLNLQLELELISEILTGTTLLPDNLPLSQKRLLSLLKRLRREPSILKDYDSIIQQQRKLGIVEVVEDPSELTSSRIQYLPHHAVVRKDKDTTKLRIVYDASAKDQGPSLVQNSTN